MKYIGTLRGRNKGDIWKLTHNCVYVCVNRFRAFYLTQAQIDHDVRLGYLKPIKEWKKENNQRKRISRSYII